MLLASAGGARFSPHHATGILHWSYSRPAPLLFIQCQTVEMDFLKREQASFVFFCLFVSSKERRCALRPWLHEWMVGLWLQRVDEPVT